MHRILIVDDKADEFEPGLRAIFPRDHLVLVHSGKEALAVLSEDEVFDVVLLDIRMPAEMGSCDEEEGLAVLVRLCDEWPELPVILLSVLSDVETVVRGMKHGAFYYVQKPPDRGKLRHLVAKAAERSRSAAERQTLKEIIDLRDVAATGSITSGTRTGLGSLVGRSAPMQALFGLIERVARANATVLILGETGTGKELVAKEIHRLSPRSGKALRVVGCPNIARELLESTLFGHRRGAFTGAEVDREGEFVLADGGTLFLDEVGELESTLQAKLLRALETGEVHPLGSRDPVKVDARIVSATHRDLRELVGEGTFREDLQYRLNVLRVELPPLRDRLDDLPFLAPALLGKIAPDRPGLHLSAEALGRLETHSWPGNVRELRNVLERAAALTDGDEITPDAIQIDRDAEPGTTNPAEAAFARALAGRPFEGGIRRFRDQHGEVALKDLLIRALRTTTNVRRAGELLGFIGAEDPKRDYDNLRQWMRKLEVSKRSALGG